ncbi:MAG: acetylglutamate kinase, partial [Actinobacteria bacterium]|nr:acetylglutamate kinase [Actinomycetota bacterium]
MSITLVKYGGAALADPELRAAFAGDLLALHCAGVRAVVVHGAGPQITAELARRGRPAVFAGGQRVTTPETLEVVRSVLVNRVNRQLVDQINAGGPVAVGM